jgi:hypothetical protein
MGIVKGIAFMATSVWGRSQRGMCADIPPNATAGQMVLVVIKFIESRPDLMHLDFRFLALAALQEAWPCPSR